MSTIKADTVQPKDFATDLTLGASGDTVTVAADSININKVQDKGGNTLWDYSTGEFVSTQPVFASQSLKLLSTAVASGSSAVSFITGIDSTYDVYIFKFIDINAATSATQFSFQVNAVGASGFNETITSTWFHAVQQEADGWAGLEYQAANDQGQGTGYQYLPVQMGAESDESAAGILYLFTPSSTTYVKHFYARFNNYGQDNTARDSFIAGYFNLTTAIDQISFKMTSGNFDGTIKMYGLL